MILTILYPLWFILIASFSDPRDVANGAVLFWPKEWTLRGYTLLFHQRTIWHSYLNTILYTVFGTLFALIINIPRRLRPVTQGPLREKIARHPVRHSDVR